MVALSEKNRSHIPYRQSKLTNILKDSIGGNCKTLMIANIWPEVRHLEETISTLKFAKRMKNVENKITINIKLDPELLLKKQEKEIRDLKLELAMHDTLANRGRISYDPYTPEQQMAQQSIATSYLKGEMEDIDIESLRQVKELFIQMRNLHRNLLNDVKTNQFVDTGSDGSEKQLKKKATMMSMHGPKDVDMVGIQENKSGFGIGKAAKGAKPRANLQSKRRHRHCLS